MTTIIKIIVIITVIVFTIIQFTVIAEVIAIINLNYLIIIIITDCWYYSFKSMFIIQNINLFSKLYSNSLKEKAKKGNLVYFAKKMLTQKIDAIVVELVNFYCLINWNI